MVDNAFLVRIQTAGERDEDVVLGHDPGPRRIRIQHAAAPALWTAIFAAAGAPAQGPPTDRALPVIRPIGSGSDPSAERFRCSLVTCRVTAIRYRLALG